MRGMSPLRLTRAYSNTTCDSHEMEGDFQLTGLDDDDHTNSVEVTEEKLKLQTDWDLKLLPEIQDKILEFVEEDHDTGDCARAEMCVGAKSVRNTPPVEVSDAPLVAVGISPGSAGSLHGRGSTLHSTASY